MTEFDEGHYNKCSICGTRYFEPEGKACTCWRCTNCNEEFEDLSECANQELWLCVYCEDERLQAEVVG